MNRDKCLYCGCKVGSEYYVVQYQFKKFQRKKDAGVCCNKCESEGMPTLRRFWEESQRLMSATNHTTNEFTWERSE